MRPSARHAWQSPATWIGLALIPLAFFFALVPLRDFDPWWHIRTGEYIVTHLRLPDQDPYSHTVPGHWINHQWLSQVLFYLIHHAFGLWGIRLLNSASAAVSAWLLWRLFIRGTGAILPSLLGFAVIFPDVMNRLIHRPEIFTVPLAIALASMLLTLDRADLTPRRMLVICGIAVVWANLHAMAVIGVIFLAAYSSGEVIAVAVRRWFNPPEWRAADRTAAARLWMLTAAVAVSVLITPIAYRIYEYVWASRDQLLAGPLQIREWQPTIGVLASVSRVLPAAELLMSRFELAFQFLYIIVPIAFFLAIPYLAWRRRLPTPAELVWTAACMYMAVPAVRLRWVFFIPLFFIARALAMVTREAPAPAPAGAAETGRDVRSLTTLVVVPAMLLVTVAGFYTVSRADVSLKKHYYEEGYPLGVTQFLKELDVGGNLFNSYNWGGYLIYSLTPQYRVFIDGRTIHYTSAGPNLVRDYIAIERKAANAAALLDDYHVDLLLSPGGEYFPRGPLAVEDEREHRASEREAADTAKTPAREPPATEGHAGWIPLLLNQEGSVYLRDNPANQRRIEAAERFFRGLGVDFTRADGPDLAQLIRKAPAVAARYRLIPSGPWKSAATLDPGKPGDALEEARLRWAQGLLTLGLFRDAADSFDRVVAAQRYNDTALLAGAYAHHLIGDDRTSKDYLERYSLFSKDPSASYMARHLREHKFPPDASAPRLPPLETLLSEWRATGAL